MGELVFTLGMLALFGLFYSGALEIDTGRSVDPVGAASVPQAVILLGAVLCVAVLVMIVKKWRAGEIKAGGRLNPRALALLGLLVAFLLLLEQIGFFLDAVLLFFALTLLLGGRPIWRAAATSIVTAGVFVLLFGRILNVPLPRGDGIFRVLSHWLF